MPFYLGVDLLTNQQLLEIPHNVSCIDTGCFHPCDSPHPTRKQKLATTIIFIMGSCKHVKAMTNLWKLPSLCGSPTSHIPTWHGITAHY